MVTPVTISKKGNYISSDAYFSWLSEYTTPMIYGSFLIEKNAKYSKKCGAISTFFLQIPFFSSHLIQNCPGIEIML
jgi:hypothetical protein